MKQKTQWPRTEIARPNIGQQCGEVVVLLAEMPGYCAVKLFANREAAEEEMELILQGYDELNAEGVSQAINPKRIRHWVLRSRKERISPNGEARFSVTAAPLFT
jgi:hypothetical protein